MKTQPAAPLIVHQFPGKYHKKNVADVHFFLDQHEKYPVDKENWEKYSLKPEVSFSLAWRKNLLFLKFYVTESVVRGIYTRDNAPVYRDSCVEFFFAPVKNGPYYNIETNCIGTCLSEKGTSRNNRVLLPPYILKQIHRYPSLGRNPFDEKPGPFSWHLLLVIPLDVITGDDFKHRTGKTIYANFYKCGDDLSQPHYLSWKPVKTPHPDFHQPDYFAPLKFI
ncbi:MAG: hypothetical protein GXO83_13660 [Chlorobi bacterium]|nr:hypothetical protein [Chlorobiota bacterium]